LHNTQLNLLRAVSCLSLDFSTLICWAMNLKDSCLCKIDFTFTWSNKSKANGKTLLKLEIWPTICCSGPLNFTGDMYICRMIKRVYLLKIKSLTITNASSKIYRIQMHLLQVRLGI
jgi:hypothetical protein